MPITVDARRRVRAVDHVNLPLRASVVWGQMRNLREFLTIDPLHHRVHFEPAQSFVPRIGTPLLIEHRLLGVGPDRLGRVLRWRELSGPDGVGEFAVSDMSRRGRRVGFPHVCAYQVRPLDDRECRLTITVRGRWTATFMPCWLVRLWLWWVMASTSRRIALHFLRFASRPLAASDRPANAA